MLRRPAPLPPIVLNPQEAARRVDGTWTFRTGTFRINWILGDIVAADGLTLRVDFTASVELLPEPAERTLFTETFGRSDTVCETDIRDHFEPPLRSAVTQLAAKDPAEVLLDSTAQSRWFDAFKTAADAVAFSCGLRVSAPVQAVVISEELDRRRRAEAHRLQIERDAEGRLAAAKHTTAMLREWQSVHEQWPNVTPGELLNRLSRDDQAAAVTDALAATAVDKAQFWAVAGNALIRLDWNEAPAAPVVFNVPAALGPLRSVRAAGDRLLLGAQRGVWFINPIDGSIIRQLIVADLRSEHGFTAAVEAGGLIWATHREAGLVAWGPVDDEPTVRVDPLNLGGPPAAMVGSQQGSHVLVAAGNQLLSVDAGQAISTSWTGTAPISVVLSMNGVVDIICNDGTATQLDEANQVISSRPTVTRAVAAARLNWLWSHRLLVVDEESSLRCFGLHDDIVTQYTAPQGIGRSVAVAGGKIIALSKDRSSLLGWGVADGRTLALQLPVTALARARAADVTAGLVAF